MYNLQIGKRQNIGKFLHSLGCGMRVCDVSMLRYDPEDPGPRVTVVNTIMQVHGIYHP